MIRRCSWVCGHGQGLRRDSRKVQEEVNTDAGEQCGESKASRKG
jgi:hypothetical protein